MNKIVKIVLILGGVASPLMVGLLVTVISILGAFRDLQAKGISDPKILADHIATSLVATMVGLVCTVLLGVGLAISLLARPKVRGTL